MLAYLKAFYGTIHTTDYDAHSSVVVLFVIEDREPGKFYPCGHYAAKAASLVSHAMEMVGHGANFGFNASWARVNPNTLYHCRATSIRYQLDDGEQVVAESQKFSVEAKSIEEAREKAMRVVNPFGNPRLDIEMEVRWHLDQSK